MSARYSPGLMLMRPLPSGAESTASCTVLNWPDPSAATTIVFFACPTAIEPPANRKIAANATAFPVAFLIPAPPHGRLLRNNVDDLDRLDSQTEEATNARIRNAAN